MLAKKHLNFKADSIGQVACKKRVFVFDNLKLLGIFCVILGHLLARINVSYASPIYVIIYLFHMPLFVYISGYFAKFNFKKDVYRILVPFLIIQLSRTAYMCLFESSSYNFFFLFLKPRWALWYLLSLFIWRLSVYFLNKLSRQTCNIISKQL